MSRFYIVIIACLFASLVVNNSSQAMTGSDIASNCFKSVATVITKDKYGNGLSIGSGFFVSKNIMVTNVHVIKGAYKGEIRIVGDKKLYSVEGIVAYDEDNDLVLLKIGNIEANPLEYNSSINAEVGEEIYAIGSPYGLEGTISKGIISGLRHNDTSEIMQITAPISPGSSGGPVVNSEGKVIGVSVATFKEGQNINFAIPVKYILNLVKREASFVMFENNPFIASSNSKKESGSATGGILQGVIVANNFSWGGGWEDFSYSIQNKLNTAVKDVVCVVVFYNNNNEPIESIRKTFYGGVEAGMAKRVTGKVDSSVQIMMRNQKVLDKVVIRVIDFNYVDMSKENINTIGVKKVKIK